MFPLNTLYLSCWLRNAFTYPKMTLNTFRNMTGNNSVAVKKINPFGKQYNFRAFKEIIQKCCTLSIP